MQMRRHGIECRISRRCRGREFVEKTNNKRHVSVKRLRQAGFVASGVSVQLELADLGADLLQLGSR